MEKLHYSMEIQAPKNKVWETMLSDKTYRKWTQPFNPGGSYFEGEWREGERMLFLGPDGNGNIGGMISTIEEVRPFDYLSIKHLGMIMDGKETYFPETQDFRENYTFNEKNNTTEVLVDLDSDEEYKDMFEEMWPKALKKLKELCES